MPDLSVIVPTYNEAGNVAELVRRTQHSLRGCDAEIIFVDDSNDETPQVIERVSRGARLPVRLIHRPPGRRPGGLGGAVLQGMRESGAPWCLVMDGDLQHPPELAPVMHAQARAGGADLVVASRYCGGGEATGLANGMRRLVSSGSTLLTRTLFPRRLRHCTDPMTGFFAVRRASVALDTLQPRGFKILLEILARHDLRVREVPFVFGERLAGESKASWRQGLHFLVQLLALRLGQMGRFAAVGLLGTFVNLAVMALALQAGAGYVIASVLATELSIIHNFLLQERFVFHGVRGGAHRFRRRALHTLAFNNAEILVRLPLLIGLVELTQIPVLVAQAALIAAGFMVRFTFSRRVVYKPKAVVTLLESTQPEVKAA